MGGGTWETFGGRQAFCVLTDWDPDWLELPAAPPAPVKLAHFTAYKHVHKQKGEKRQGQPTRQCLRRTLLMKEARPRHGVF